MNINYSKLTTLFLFLSLTFGAKSQLFQDDFGTAFASLSTVKWPSGCRSGSFSNFNTSVGGCAGAGDYNYALSSTGYITSQGIAIPASGYELTFSYSYSNTYAFPSVQIWTGTGCGTILQQTEVLTNTSGVCTPHTIDLSAYAGQTIFIRLLSNSSPTSTYWDDILVDVGAGGGVSCLLDDDFGTAFASLDAVNWPSACRGGSPSGFNTSIGPCYAVGDYNYGLSGFGAHITSLPLAIPSTGFDLTFTYSFDYFSFSSPDVEIRTGGTCGTTLLATTTLAPTAGVCTPQTINLDAYAGQTIFVRFVSNTSSEPTYLDDVKVCGSGGGGTSGDYKWADNFNDNDLDLDYVGNDGDEACTGCGQWTLNGGATLDLVPSGGWQGNSNTTEAFPDAMANVYYVHLDRDEWIESPTIDMSGKESLKISFYAKSSSSGTGGGDSWSAFSDHLRLQIWDGSAWITVKDITEGTSVEENQILPALPFNYFCFSAYKTASSPGNYYYSNAPNVDASYFHSDFKFRVIFEGGFSGAPFAWVDDFTFRADADGYSTMIPCGLSFWNQPLATSYGQDTGTTGNNNAEKGVELELDNSINIPPVWASEANDGDTVTQVFGLNESERVVFAVLSEQEINFAFPRVNFYAPSMGWQSATMSIDNNYTGPGWLYYNVQYISCDLAGGSIGEPTNDYQYYYTFEYGNEFIPVFYHLNTSGIESGGGATSSFEVFNAPDVNSTDNCGLALSVELLDFTVTPKERAAELNWTTLSEINNERFDIEKSEDGLNYVKIGSVSGAGTTSETTTYSWVDNQPIFGTSYYRLKQVDFDGAYVYSNVEALALRGGAIALYPNPVKELLVVLIDSEEINILDAMGRPVNDLVQVSANLVNRTVDVSKLKSGVYFIESEGRMYQFIKE